MTMWWGGRRIRLGLRDIGCMYLILIIICCPALIWILVYPFQWFVDYLDWGQEHFGFENKSFGIMVWSLLPMALLGITCFSLEKYFNRRKQRKKDIQKLR